MSVNLQIFGGKVVDSRKMWICSVIVSVFKRSENKSCFPQSLISLAQLNTFIEGLDESWEAIEGFFETVSSVLEHTKWLTWIVLGILDIKA